MSGDFYNSINKGEGITQAFVRKMQESGKIKKSKIDWNSVLTVLNDEKSYCYRLPWKRKKHVCACHASKNGHPAFSP